MTPTERAHEILSKWMGDSDCRSQEYWVARAIREAETAMQEPMKCGHPRACWVDEATPTEDRPMRSQNGRQFCSDCERETEKVEAAEQASLNEVADKFTTYPNHISELATEIIRKYKGEGALARFEERVRREERTKVLKGLDEFLGMTSVSCTREAVHEAIRNLDKP